MEIIKQIPKDIIFVSIATIAYGSLAAAFSILGIFIPERQFLDTPLTGGLNIEHILGHVAWGLMIGALSFRLRYFLLAGCFAIIIDFDHLIHFLDIEAIGRMGHSIPFGLISMVVIMSLFGKRDYLLGVIAFSAMLAHVSFDTLTGSGNFPLFVPLYNELVRFPHSFWYVFQLIGAAIVLTTVILTKKSSKK